MDKKSVVKISEYYYDRRGKRITSNYEEFYRYVSKHPQKSMALYAEWFTDNNLVITSVSAYYDNIEKSVTKINRESI